MSEGRGTLLIVALVVVMGILGYVWIVENPGALSINLPGFSFPIDLTVNTQGGGQTEAPGDLETRQPTSLTLYVAPNPANKGGIIMAQVVSNGVNADVTLHATHLGVGQSVSMVGLLDQDGKFSFATQINLAGYWEAWATSGAVESSRVRFTVQGLHIAVEGDTVTVFSNLRGACQVWADDPARSVSIPLGTTTINSGGCGSVHLDLSDPVWVPGSYEIDCIVSGTTAKSKGGTAWMVLK